MTAISTKVALLQALMQGESYGLELIERVEKATGGRTTLMQGKVYPTLHQLESEGLLESYHRAPLPQPGGRPRHYFKLTGEGRRAARENARAIAGLFRNHPDRGAEPCDEGDACDGSRPDESCVDDPRITDRLLNTGRKKPHLHG